MERTRDVFLLKINLKSIIDDYVQSEIESKSSIIKSGKYQK
jgi:hypothetical protein